MHKELSLYLTGAKTSSVLLCGQPGSPLLDDAFHAASNILGTSYEKLSSHPDYLYIERGKENFLGVDTAECILTKASIKPSLANVLVIVVHEFDRMTEAAQNKLLKLLEDNCGVIVIGTVFKNSVLPTIKSRMRIIHYKALSHSEFAAYLNNSADVELLYWITGGYPGLVDEFAGAVPIFKEIVSAYISQKPTSFFKICNLVEEKDKNCFYSKYPMLVKQLFCLIGQLISETLQYNLGISGALITQKLSYSDEALLACSIIVNDAITECENSYYSQHNFFWAMAQIIENLI